MSPGGTSKGPSGTVSQEAEVTPTESPLCQSTPPLVDPNSTHLQLSPTINGNQAVIAYQTLRRQSLLLESRTNDPPNDFYYNRVEKLIQKLENLTFPHDGSDLMIQLTEEWAKHLEALYQLQAQRPAPQRARSMESPRSNHDSLRSVFTSEPSGRSDVQIRPMMPSTQGMKVFDGKASSWPSFRVIFMENIGNHPSASQVCKLDLLASLLPQHADLVKCCNTCQEALDTVAPQYSGVGVLWSELMKTVDGVPDLKAKSSIAEWRKLESALFLAKRHVEPTDKVGQYRVHTMLKGKMPEAAWNQYHDSGQKTIEELTKFVANKIVSLRDAEDERRFLHRSTSSTREAEATKQHPRSKARLYQEPLSLSDEVVDAHVNVVSREGTNIGPCMFCQQIHLRKLCPLPRTQRLIAIRKGGRCTTCLRIRENHMCHGQGCRHCDSGLNGLLCTCLQDKRDPQPSPASIPTQTKPKQVARASSNPQVNVVVDQWDSDEQEEIVSTVRSEKKEQVTYLPTLRATAHRPGEKDHIVTRVLLDEAATSSFLAEHVADRLRLEKRPIPPFSVKVFGGAGRIPIAAETTVLIRSLANPLHSITVPLYITSGIIMGQLPAASKEIQSHADRLGITLTDINSSDRCASIDILIGQDLYTDYVLLERQQSLKFQPGVAFVETKLGWTVRGKPGGRQPQGPIIQFMGTGPNRQEGSAAYVAFTEQKCICQELSTLMLGYDSNNPSDDVTIQKWVEEFQSKIQYDQQAKRFSVPLPWFGDERPASNYFSAKKQCIALHARLSRNHELESYDQAMHALVEEGHAQILPRKTETVGYYLPHFPVYKASSLTTPMRPVFNASAAGKDAKALNQCIFKGGWAHVQLVEVLLRWRTHAFVVLADIKKAFLQIRVQPDDCKYLRFLWPHQGEVRIFEMNSVLFGAAAAPYILFAVLRLLFQRHASHIAHVTKNIYMDDIILAESSEAELHSLVTKVKDTMALGSFQLHKWAAVSTMAKRLNIPTTTNSTTCLGQNWDLVSDEIHFLSPSIYKGRMTRRTLTSEFARTFDPLQLLGPFHTQVKLMFRNLIPSSQDWDAEVSAEVREQATALLDDLKWLPKIRLPRLTCTDTNFEVWGFGDASAVAFGAVFYMHNTVQGSSRILLARGHLSGKKKTIPQLELMAATLVAETLPVVIDCCPRPPSMIRLFTDSQVTWHRLHSDPNKHEPFVATRIKRVLQLTSENNWYFLRTKANPADLISRGKTLQSLHNNHLWFNGPTLSDIETAKRETEKLTTNTACVMLTYQDTNPPLLSHLLNSTKQSHEKLYNLLYCLMRYMSRFVNLIGRFKASTGVQLGFNNLVNVYKWRLLQQVMLPDEVQCLKRRQAVAPTSPLARLALVVDQLGIIRLDRRLEHSDHSDEVKYPIVLHDSVAARQYIAYVHQRHSNHGGAAVTECLFKRTAFMINSARIVQEVVADCITCRRYRFNHNFASPMAPLPECRVTRGYAFQSIGVDIAGPIKGDGKEGKYYFIIFTCLRARAIHLELLQSRETRSITRAFTRFCCLYGRPREIWSDNELGFKKLGRSLSAMYKRYCEALQVLERRDWFANTQWHFNVPAAPWRGGVWESLIGSVKSAIHRTHLSAASDFESLLTVLWEAQSFINSRPIWHKTTLRPLTPAHLVFGRPLDFPMPLSLPIHPKKEELFLDYASLQFDLNELWDNWRLDYLTSLKLHYWASPAPPKKGELVLIKDGRVSRYEWPLAIITDIRPSSDGYFRTAKVKLINGNKGEFRRAIQSLVPVERAPGGENSLPLLPPGVIPDVCALNDPRGGDGRPAAPLVAALNKQVSYQGLIGRSATRYKATGKQATSVLN